ncbi:MAG: O-antigen ligase family protein, partial [Clostridia bacterium]|nr:O-antigen ligase family protein [Clostridia bacterium]
MTFFGHVQLVSQICILAIFSALTYWEMYKTKQIKIILILVFAFYNLITVDALASRITCICLLIFLFLSKIGMSRVLQLSSRTYIILGFIASILIVSASVINNECFNTAIRFLDFSGRGYVWVAAIKKIKDSILIGYGIEGIQLSVFWNKWTNVSGFNYTHNQVLQSLLDGGLLLLLSYFIMLLTSCKNIKKIKDAKIKVLTNSCLICFLLIMICESTSL